MQLRGGRHSLAGQDPAFGQIARVQRIVVQQLDIAAFQLAHARGAATDTAGGGRIEAGTLHGGQHRFAAVAAQLIVLAIQAHRQLCGHGGFAAADRWLFAFAGHLFIAMQTDIPSVRETADIYLPYLAVLPLIAVWSYLLDGLFIGATRAREMRDGMLLTVMLVLPIAWALQGVGNHGLWITFLLFMAVRSLILGAIAWWLSTQNRWLSDTR